MGPTADFRATELGCVGAEHIGVGIEDAQQFRFCRQTRISCALRRFTRSPAAIIHCRSVSLLTFTAWSLAKYSQASAASKSRYFAFTNFSTLLRRLCRKRRFDSLPRSRCDEGRFHGGTAVRVSVG
ncbi:MAG: hypothetical protein ABSH01_01045 [Terriglobia bacterium]